MNPFEPALKKMELIRANLKPVLDRVLSRHKDFIEELNRKQLGEGKRRDNTSLPNYVVNSRQPAAPGVIKLRNKGKFYSEIMADINQGVLDIVNNDHKAEFLVPKYGKILGLSDESVRMLWEKIGPDLIGEFRRL